MSYVPLARKYRPQTFADLVGQPHVTATLTRALEQQRIAQAYLFTGLRGVGKTSAARILAKCLNCTDGPTATPCNRCASCTQITQGNSLDVIEIDGASNRGIDEIRTLRETVPFAPTSGPFRVYIIDEVHMLTTEAFNALLKTLEEPPAHSKFIFATTAANKVPATILSRCQRFDFRRIDAATTVDVLKRVATTERVTIDEPALYAIARACDGSLRDAQVILDQLGSFVKGAIHETDVTELLGSLDAESLHAMTHAILERDPSTILTVLAQQLDQGKDASQVLLGLLRHLRNLLILCTTQQAASRREVVSRLIDEPAERLTHLEEQAQRATAQEWLMCLQILVSTYELVRRSPMGHTVLELALIKLSTREQWQSLEQISRRLEQLSTRHETSEGPKIGAAHRTISTTPPFSSTSSVNLAQSTKPADAAAVPVTGVAQAPAAALATPVPEDLVMLWPTFLERLGAQKMSLAAYLAESQPVSLDAGVCTIGVEGFTLHQEVLSHTENRRLVEQLLGELCQVKVSVQYTVLQEPSAASTGSADASTATKASSPIVQEIVNLFNATILDQPRPI